MQKLTPGFQNHMRSLENLRQAVESQKIWNLTDYFSPKNTFLQLKYYVPMIYLTLLSATCVKIHQVSYVTFETISHFSRHNSSVFFLAQTLHTFDKSSPSNCKLSDFPLLGLTLTKFLLSFFSFSSIFGTFSSVMGGNSSVIF